MGSRDANLNLVYPTNGGLQRLDKKCMTVTFNLHNKDGEFIRCEEVMFEVEADGKLTIRVDEKSTANIGYF